MIYLASPYSHQNEKIRLARFKAVCSFAAELIKAGNVVYSPIAHSHPIAETNLIGRETAIWIKQQEPFLKNSLAVVVYQLPGWEMSEGIREEVKLAIGLKIPVIYVPGPNLKFDE